MQLGNAEHDFPHSGISQAALVSKYFLVLLYAGDDFFDGPQVLEMGLAIFGTLQVEVAIAALIAE